MAARGMEEDRQSQKSTESSRRSLGSRRKPPVSFKSTVDEEHVVKLLSFFAQSNKKQRTDDMYEVYQKMCLVMLSKDYEVVVLKNRGSYCPSYPLDILIPVTEKTPTECMKACSTSLHETLTNGETMRNRILGSRHARCRDRFVVPAFMFNGKAVCRSATLSSFYEAYGRHLLGSLNGDAGATSAAASTTAAVKHTAEFDKLSSDQQPRVVDVEMLKSLEVDQIFDLMVECKKVKYNMFWSSSEKVDEYGQYGGFNITQIPYPGCEYFRDVAQNKNNAEGMVFDWSQSFVNSRVNVQTGSQLNIRWDEYKSWDLVELTQNYVLVMLEYLTDETKGGLLVHCISGWDRTPLFVSLLRLSLWADGLLHQSLDPLEMLFFTISYDWLLFGHQLSTRLQSGELIFFFCFNFLQYLEDDRFSAMPHTSPSSPSNSSDASLDSGVQGVSGATSASISPDFAATSSNAASSQEVPAQRPSLLLDSKECSGSGAEAANQMTASLPSDKTGDQTYDTVEATATSSDDSAATPPTTARAIPSVTRSSSVSPEDLQEWADEDSRVGLMPRTRQARLAKLREIFLASYELASSKGMLSTSSWSLPSVSGMLSSVRSLVSAPRPPDS